MADASWEKFDEKHPFGKNSKVSTVAVIGGDNIPHSQKRVEAIRAMKAGRATPDQVSLVQRADEIIQEALALQQS